MSGFIRSGSATGAPATSGPAPLRRWRPRFPITADNESGEFRTKADPWAIGAVDDGLGDHGGKSYGVYQFASHDGQLARFIASLKEPLRGPLADHQIGSPQFDAAWESLAKTFPDAFALAQEDFFLRDYTDELAKFEAASGVDLSSRSDALRDIIFGTVNQFGDLSYRGMARAVRAAGGNKLSDRAVVAALNGYKIANVDDLFSNSDAATRRGVVARFREEMSLV